jgi:hypothetical protein
MHKEAVRLVKKLGLKKHPEGGYFKQTYRSDMMVNVAGYDGQRNISTAIYCLRVGGQYSAFHKMKSDEIWHHYAGGSLTLYAINEYGTLSRIRLGRGGTPQAVIKVGTWFAAALNNKKSYSLVGCTMSPGFDYRDWELGKRDELARMYPPHRALIERYTK